MKKLAENITVYITGKQYITRERREMEYMEKIKERQWAKSPADTPPAPEFSGKKIRVPSVYAPKSDASIWKKYRRIPDLEREILTQSPDMRAELRARLLQEVIDCAFFNPMDLFDPEGNLRPVDQIAPHVGIAISGLEVTSRADRDGDGVETVRKLKLIDKSRYLYLLAKLLRMLDGGSGGDDPLSVVQNRYDAEQRRIAERAIERLRTAEKRMAQQRRIDETPERPKDR